MDTGIIQSSIDSCLEFESVDTSKIINVFILDTKDRCKDDIDYYRSFLNVDELEKSKRFGFEEDKISYIASHALLRFVLSRYLNQAPRTLEFIIGKFGKPDLHPRHNSSLKFNLSHTQGLVGCAVVLSGKLIGFDVDKKDEKFLDIIERFSKDEIHRLNNLNRKNKIKFTSKLWSLKESYLKAIGVGLTWPLNSFSVKYIKNEFHIFTHSQKLHPNLKWKLYSLDIDEYVCAIAVQKSNSPYQLNVVKCS